jgi:hypothetical protein
MEPLDPALQLENLPEHVLVKIFSYTKPSDRLNLILVNRKFNDLITNVKETMQDIQITWNEFDGADEMEDLDEFLFTMLQSNRKYLRLSIVDSHLFSSFLFLSRFQSLREVELNITHLELEALSAIVNNLPLLEALEINDNMPINSRESSVAKLNCKKLKRYSWSVMCLVQFFEEIPALEELELSHGGQNELTASSLGELRNILLNLSTLKSLSLIEVDVIDQNFQNPKFKLQQLEILSDNNLKEVIRFIETQVELQKLTVTLVPATISELLTSIGTVLSLPKLKSLSVNWIANTEGEFEEDPDFVLKVSVNRTIEEFTLSDDTDGMIVIGPQQDELRPKFFEGCFSKIPNVKILNLRDFIPFKGKDLSFLNSFGKLEAISFSTLLDDPVLPYLELKSLESITITIEIPDELQDDRIEQLVIECSQMLIEFFEKHRKLKSFHLRYLMIQENVWLFVKNNLHSLKQFSIVADSADFGRFHGRKFLVSDEEFKIKVKHDVNPEYKKIVGERFSY